MAKQYRGAKWRGKRAAKKRRQNEEIWRA